jgi:hypothetical protein
MTDTKKDLIEYRLNRAKDTLDDAHILAEKIYLFLSWTPVRLVPPVTPASPVATVTTVVNAKG